MSSFPSIAPIRLVVVLWQHPHFGGYKRVFPLAEGLRASVGELGPTEFDNQTSAIGIHPGPNFDFLPDNPPTVSFFADPWFQGEEWCLPVGAYPDLYPPPFHFDNVISSIRFNGGGNHARHMGHYAQGASQSSPDRGITGVTAGPAATIASIPVVILLRQHWGSLDAPPTALTLVESTPDLAGEYGPDWPGANVIELVPGPNPPGKVRCYRKAYPDEPGKGPLQGGGFIELSPGPIYNLNDYAFAGEVHAIRIMAESAQPYLLQLPKLPDHSVGHAPNRPDPQSHEPRCRGGQRTMARCIDVLPRRGASAVECVSQAGQKPAFALPGSPCPH